MSTKVVMPQMGESIFEGTITKWLKKVGDTVTRDEPLFEISTDKVDSEIPAPASGVLSQILVPEGTTVQINTTVAIIGDDALSSKTEVPEEKVAVETIATEEASESISPVPEAREVHPKVGEPQSESQSKLALAASTVQPRDIRTSPLVRRLARENNIDLGEVRGTGLEGRITKEDILNHIARRSETAVVVQPPRRVVPEEAPPRATPAREIPVQAVLSEVPKSMPPAEAPRFFGETEVVTMTPMRKAIAEHMVMSKRTSAHVNTVFEVDMSAIVNLREKHKQEFEKREGINLTYTPFFVKALVDTVREFPVLNCSVSGETILYKKPVNVGIAVALETGLIVPVVKDAQLKSFTGLALAIHDLAERARSKRLKPEEVQNGTISITNPGIYGSLFGTPIISQPQVAILGVGGIEKRPVVINDAIAIRSMVFLSLTFDHRVVDGAVADQFMAGLKARLQAWIQWLD
jgi:pyruvate dehydrogenase E2 component (dihydrolipoamide acetyltransferase)